MITIIGVLASLVVAVAVGVIDRGKQTRITAGINQLQITAQDYRNQYGSYPPNVYNDSATSNNANALIRHLKKAFPRINPTELNHALRLAGVSVSGGPRPLDPPLTAAEAAFFWFSGYSSDPEYPLTGQSGPLYIPLIAPASTATDPYDNRDDRTIKDVFQKDLLEPSRSFQIGANSFVQLFVYHPTGFSEPFVYFDTSRQGKMIPADAIALRNLFAYKSSGAIGTAKPFLQEASGAPPSLKFVNAQSFQILHAGTDNEWGTDIDPDDPVLYPTGPYVAEMADNLSNFTTKTLEDAQEE